MPSPSSGGDVHLPAEIRFQELQEQDIPLMHRWLNTSFVNRWWGQKPLMLTEVQERYLPYARGEKPTLAFVILYRENPIGYIQAYKISDYPEYSRYVQVEENAAGVDLFIGEPGFIHQGLGPILLRQFLQQVVFGSMDVVSCILGPEPGNRAAIRCYEKVGFRYLKTIQVPGEEEPEYLMRIGRNA